MQEANFTGNCQNITIKLYFRRAALPLSPLTIKRSENYSLFFFVYFRLMFSGHTAGKRRIYTAPGGRF